MAIKQKHLTLEDRIDFQAVISQQGTFRSIAKKLKKGSIISVVGKSQTEIMSHFGVEKNT